jgi:hypothetical protein
MCALRHELRTSLPTLNDTTVIDTSASTTTIDDTSVVIAGKGTPNTDLKLYIYPETQTITVKTDENGNWSYTVTGLVPGEYRVETDTIDATNNAVTGRTVIARFVVTGKNQTAPQPTVANESPNNLLLVVVMGSLFIVGVAVLFFTATKQGKRYHQIIHDRIRNFVRARK